MDDGLIGPWRSSYIQHQNQVMMSVEFVWDIWIWRASHDVKAKLGMMSKSIDMLSLLQQYQQEPITCRSIGRHRIAFPDVKDSLCIMSKTNAAAMTICEVMLILQPVRKVNYKLLWSQKADTTTFLVKKAHTLQTFVISKSRHFKLL